MADSNNARVAVYIDFDNIVISQYDRVFGDGKWRADGARNHGASSGSDDPVANRLAEAEVNIGAVLDYASSFGTVAVSRAYADWSVPANAAYRQQLMDRAVDLTQLFVMGGTKNGADIRLSVDAIEDLFQYADLTHVVVVAGDSDYVALAQRCKQLGRFVVGIGVAKSTGRALVAACDEFSSYDDLPGVTPPELPAKPAQDPTEPESAPPKKTARKTSKKTAAKKVTEKTPAKPAEKPAEPSPQDEATTLLVRAARNAQSKNDQGWLWASGLKSTMQRLDPGFKEKTLGYKSFADFVESRADVVESRTSPDGQLQLRLRSSTR